MRTMRRNCNISFAFFQLDVTRIEAASEHRRGVEAVKVLQCLNVMHCFYGIVCVCV
jgi:hypothetical protein